MPEPSRIHRHSDTSFLVPLTLHRPQRGKRSPDSVARQPNPQQPWVRASPKLYHSTLVSRFSCAPDVAALRIQDANASQLDKRIHMNGTELYALQPTTHLPCLDSIFKRDEADSVQLTFKFRPNDCKINCHGG
uniref:Uncharacterized protein n=1 Tax=Mycena chlorophos TaxID=658473 RepID=A0ABQ0LPG2_MYCCL|nr:predicted protein [Mycena chlorophos]